MLAIVDYRNYRVESSADCLNQFFQQVEYRQTTYCVKIELWVYQTQVFILQSLEFQIHVSLEFTCRSDQL